MRINWHFINATRKNAIAACQWMENELANTPPVVLSEPRDHTLTIQVYGDDNWITTHDGRSVVVAFTVTDDDQPYLVHQFTIHEEFPNQSNPELRDENGEWPPIELDLTNRNIPGITRTHEEEG